MMEKDHQDLMIDSVDMNSMPQKSGEEGVNLKRRLFRINTLIGFVLAGIIIYVFITRFNLDQAISIIMSSNFMLLLLAFLVFYGFLPLRGHRWHVLLLESDINLPVVELTRLYFIAWFANSILPARIGDIYRAYLLKKNRQVSFSLSLGVIFSERIFDLASTALLVVISGLFYMDKVASPTFKNRLIIGLVAIACIVIAFAIFSWRSRWLKRFLPQKFQGHFESFRRGLFRSPAKLPFISLESLIIWLSEAGRLYFVAWALGFRIDFLLALFVSQAALIIMSLPLTPAGLGLVELLMFGILIPAGLSHDAAAAIVIADRLISYWSLIFLGAIHYIISPRYR
jgi:uncharacterized protein (TIRG00374 family)